MLLLHFIYLEDVVWGMPILLIWNSNVLKCLNIIICWILSNKSTCRFHHWHSYMGLINLLSCHAINPESHLPWEWKSKRAVKRVKGWLTSEIRNYFPWESMTFIFYLFISFVNPVSQGFPLYSYLNITLAWYDENKLMILSTYFHVVPYQK